MRELKESTRIKYTNFIEECYKRKLFSKQEMRDLYNADTNIFTALQRLNMIKKTNGLATGMCQWIGPEYSSAVLNQIMKEYIRIGTMKNLKRYGKRIKMNSTSQLQLPVQSIPVVHEVECDNSNSKMLLIMAVGAAIGFLIATAIWK